MHKLSRYINQNRKKIIIIIAFILFLFFMYKILANINKQNVKSYISYNNANDTENQKKLVSDKSLTSGQTISKNKLEDDTEIINKFVDFCNKKDIKSAYDLLTDECKENVFPTIEDFNSIYYSYLFNNKKIHTIENWINNTYQVRFSEDMVNNGKLSSNSTKEDYITINSENKKLNINNYIGRTTFDKVIEKDNIKIIVKNVDVYMDHEIYNLSITNESNKTILMDPCKDSESIYLLDSNGVKHYVSNTEIVENRLLIRSMHTNNIDMKFLNSYTRDRKIEKIVFSKVVLDNSIYSKNFDNYKFTDFQIEL